MTQVIQQLLPGNVLQAYRGGFDQAEGYVVDAADTTFAVTAADVLAAFGVTDTAPAYLAPDGSVHLLRLPVSPFHRLTEAFGPEIAPPGAPSFLDPPPFTGTGFTACREHPVPLWRLGRSRLVPGTELWQVQPDGSEQFVDVYRDVAAGWANAPMGPPSPLLGSRATWQGLDCLADLVDDGATVVLAALGAQVPQGFEPARPYVSVARMPAGAVGTLTDRILSCRWRGEPFEVVTSGGGQAVLTYTGGDHRVAGQLGLRFAQPSVYETTVATAELADVGGIENELPLG